ncbi:MAG: RtcB family protein [Acidobacteria bacterium]|nr:RtcB family protein [Acidobacteriota bacterium]
MPFKMEEIFVRLDKVRVSIKNPFQIPVTLFAREDVDIGFEAVNQLLEFISLEKTLQQLGKDFWGDNVGQIKEVILTPDFHKGAGIPVGTVVNAQGFVIPQAIGNDICCGMRLLVTDLKKEEFLANQKPLEKQLRAIFFEGKRQLPLSSRQREALLKEGLWGLQETFSDNANVGLWSYYDPIEQAKDLSFVHFQGVLPTQTAFTFDDFIKSANNTAGYDSQIGSIGGGNHFVEIQTIEELLDGATSHSWGITSDQITIMVHSGSVGLGHLVGGHFRDRAKEIFPSRITHPEYGFYPLPTDGKEKQLTINYLNAMRCAANFAFANRLFLGLMIIRAFSEVLGRKVASKLIYDAPHNLIWENEPASNCYLHRKGACPAIGAEPEINSPFRYTGHPVIIPGSMGDASYLLAGQGSSQSLTSACHGAGRSLARGEARIIDQTTYQSTISKLKVVTPIDPNAPEVRLRPDILAKYHDRLKEEAPYAYKPINPIVETIEEASIARRVARLSPLMTIKG